LNTKKLLLIFSVVEVLFFLSVLSNLRGYQDLWLLQDIYIPTIAYVITFIIVSLNLDDNRALVFVCAAFLITLNVIPAIKYQFFVGTFDSAAHYGFANQILQTGHVSTTAFYSDQYADFPGMHLFLSFISLILGINLVGAVKLLTSIIYGSIPFFFYFVSNRIHDKRLQKYIIISSGLPVTAMSYNLGGAEFATPIFVAFLCVLLRRNSTNPKNKSYTAVLVLLFVGLLFSHAVTSLSLTLFLGLMLFILILFGLLKRSRFCYTYFINTIGLFIIMASMLIAWFSLKANSIFDLFVTVFQSYLSSKVDAAAAVPSTFFRMPLVNQISVLTLYHARDAVVLLLSILGVIILFKVLLSKNRHLSRNLFFPLLCLLTAILLLLGFDYVTGRTEYVRFIYYALALSPFLMGLSFLGLEKYLNKIVHLKFVRLILLFAILFSVLSISIIQVFPYQPLMPTANVVSKTLPSDEYLFDVGDINTIYQVDMINFASNHSPGSLRVTSDLSTMWQIAGFASENFSNQHVGYSPLQTNLTNVGVKWDIFLTHYDGKAGSLNEFIENRTRTVLDEIKQNSGSVIYDNGESFIIFQAPVP
jgi:hypothetical protein